jgi:hypothetical protein
VVTDDDVRRIALSLPETTERPSYGTPGFRVKDKLFARLREDGALAVYVSALDEKDALIAAEPDIFFTTPHYDGYAMVLVRLDAVGPQELTEVLTDAWRVRAPGKVRAAFEAAEAAGRDAAGGD